MTIEITDEMREAFQVAAGWPGPPWRFGVDVANGLSAVLALVERDYAIAPQGCVEPAPGEPMAYCELARGHRGKHTATVEKAVDW